MQRFFLKIGDAGGNPLQPGGGAKRGLKVQVALDGMGAHKRGGVMNQRTVNENLNPKKKVKPQVKRHFIWLKSPEGGGSANAVSVAIEVIIGGCTCVPFPTSCPLSKTQAACKQHISQSLSDTDHLKHTAFRQTVLLTSPLLVAHSLKIRCAILHSSGTKTSEARTKNSNPLSGHCHFVRLHDLGKFGR